MNVPPGAPPPPVAGPPPAAPKSGGFPWKWVLIGCGTIVFLGVLVCGGATWWIASTIKGIQKKLEGYESSIKANPEVTAELGAVKHVKPRDNQHPAQRSDGSMLIEADVLGEKADGTLECTLKQEGRFSVNVVSVVIVLPSGKRISIPEPPK